MKKSARFLLLGALLAVGCGGSGDRSLLLLPSDTPPVLQSKRYQAIGNAVLRVAADKGVLVGQDLQGAVFTGFSGQTANQGQLEIAADGSFRYTPAPGFRGEDTTALEIDGASATLTFVVERRAIFVNNTAAAGGDGTQAAPFNTLSAGVGAANQASDILFIFRGDGTAANLGGSQALSVDRLSFVGEAAGLTTPEGVIVEPGDYPVLSDSLVVTGDNVTVAGVELREVPDTVGAIQFNGVAGASVRQVRVIRPAASGVLFSAVTDAGEVRGSSFELARIYDGSPTGQSAVDLVQSAGSANITVADSSFANSEDDGPRTVYAVFDSNARASLDFTNNTIAETANQRGWRSGVAIDTTGTAEVDFRMTGNSDIRGTFNKAVDLDVNEDSVLRTTMTNNTLRVRGGPILAEFYSNGGGGVTLRDNHFFAGAGAILGGYSSATVAFDIQNNQFRDENEQPQRLYVYQDGAGAVNLTLLANLFSEARIDPDGGVINVLRVADLAALESANTGTITAPDPLNYIP